MSIPSNRFVAIGAFISRRARRRRPGVAQNDGKPKPNARPAGQERRRRRGALLRQCRAGGGGGAHRLGEKRLDELEGQIKQRIAELEKKEAEARDWVDKREALMNSASDDVVAIYGKMEPEAAAAQLACDGRTRPPSPFSASSTRDAASAILNEMQADKAGKLTGVMSGAAVAEKKS